MDQIDLQISELLSELPTDSELKLLLSQLRSQPQPQQRTQQSHFQQFSTDRLKLYCLVCYRTSGHRTSIKKSFSNDFVDHVKHTSKKIITYIHLAKKFTMFIERSSFYVHNHDMARDVVSSLKMNCKNGLNMVNGIFEMIEPNMLYGHIMSSNDAIDTKICRDVMEFIVTKGIVQWSAISDFAATFAEVIKDFAYEFYIVPEGQLPSPLLFKKASETDDDVLKKLSAAAELLRVQEYNETMRSQSNVQTLSTPTTATQPELRESLLQLRAHLAQPEVQHSLWQLELEEEARSIVRSELQPLLLQLQSQPRQQQSYVREFAADRLKLYYKLCPRANFKPVGLFGEYFVDRVKQTSKKMTTYMQIAKKFMTAIEHNPLYAHNDDKARDVASLLSTSRTIGVNAIDLMFRIITPKEFSLQMISIIDEKMHERIVCAVNDKKDELSKCEDPNLAEVCAIADFAATFDEVVKNYVYEFYVAPGKESLPRSLTEIKEVVESDDDFWKKQSAANILSDKQIADNTSQQYYQNNVFKIPIELD